MSLAADHRDSITHILPQDDPEYVAHQEARASFVEAPAQSSTHISAVRQSRLDSIVLDDESPEDETNWVIKKVSCCRMFCTGPWLLTFLCLYTLVQSMVVTGLTSGSASTVQLRYDLDSTTMGFIFSTYDFTYMLAAPVVGYFGHSRVGHSPRWLAGGFALLCLGSLLYSSPHYFSSKYDPQLDDVDTDFCQTLPFTPDCTNSGTSLVFIFFLAQIVIALGATPLYTLGPAYLDQVVDNLALPTYLGAFYAFAAFGPAAGFILQSIFLALWVEPGEEPANVERTDPEWVGAWWLGYLVTGLIGLLAAFPGFLFPKFLPDTQKVRKANKHEAAVLKEKLTTLGHVDEKDSIWSGVCQLLRNPTFVFNCLAQATEGFMVAGFALFMPSIIQSMFGVSAAASALLTGITVIPGGAGGIYFGGWLMRRYQLSGVSTAKMAFIVGLIATVFMFGFGIGCDTVKLAGITTPYPDNSAQPSQFVGGVGDIRNLTASCNAGCVCDNDKYIPVCGENGVNYFSACHAGCLNKTGTGKDATFFNCQCVTPLNATLTAFAGGFVDNGKCATGCNNLFPFLLLLFFIMFTTFTNNVPAVSVVLRSVQPNLRGLAGGVQNMFLRALGTIPGPVLFGVMVDSTCTFHETLCGKNQQACWEYENNDLRVRMVLFAILPKLASTLFFFLSWWNFKSVGHSLDTEVLVELDKVGSEEY